MELRQILRIFVKQWWLIIPTIFIALTGSLLFSYSRTPIYEASASFVTVFSYNAVTDQQTIIYGLETLAGQQGIFVTYCEIMKSDAVAEEAYRLIGVEQTPETSAKYKIGCTNLPETNVILLTVQGPSPALVERLTSAIGLAGTARANTIYDFFPLTPLDAVYVEDIPVSPKHTQNAALGVAFGLILGVSAALMVEYLRHPGERITAMSIRNPQVGIYNDLYFERRTEEELQRAHIRNRPISMSLLRIIPDEDFYLMSREVQNILIRKVALLLEENIGQTNLIAYLKPMLIGVLLVETPAGEADNQIKNLQELLRAQSMRAEGGFQATFRSKAGIVASSGNLMTYAEMYATAQQALKTSESSANSQTYLVQGVPRPFMDEMEMEQIDKGEQRSQSKTDPFTTNEDLS